MWTVAVPAKLIHRRLCRDPTADLQQVLLRRSVDTSSAPIATSPPASHDSLPLCPRAAPFGEKYKKSVGAATLDATPRPCPAVRAPRCGTTKPVPGGFLLVLYVVGAEFMVVRANPALFPTSHVKTLEIKGYS